MPSATVTRLEAGAVPLTVVSPPVQQEAVLRATDATQQAVTALGERQAAAAFNGPPQQNGERVTATRTQEQLPLFYRYEIQNGDSVIGIAARFGIGSQYIVWNNLDIISDQHLLTVGEKLQIPSVEGILHQVKVGETITDIATQYEAKANDIIAFPANGLANNPNLLKEGSTVLVPGGRVVPRPAPSIRPTPAPAAAAPEPAQPPRAASNAAAAAPAPASRTGWIWPVVHNVTSHYGPIHPLGIDIEAPYVPVAAAKEGQVVFAGGDPCCSYGWNVVIRHEGGFESRYAHLSAIHVKLGQFVEQGQTIGVSGRTGRATGPHLHFEIWKDGRVVNPLAQGLLP